MKKRKKSYTVVLVILTAVLILTSLPSRGEIRKGKGDSIPSILENSSYPVYTPAGMNTYITDEGKNHSHKAHVEVPHAEEKHIEATVHTDPHRQKIRVAHLKCPFRIPWRGFDFEIQSAVYNYAKDVYEAQGYIKSPFLGGTVYAQDIEFNKSGITRVEGLTSPLGGWNVAGFLFMPEKGGITWTGNFIQARGTLNCKKFFLDITLEVSGSEAKIVQLHKQGFGLVEHRPADITGVELRGNQLYISGKTLIYTGQVYYFNHLPVSHDGTVKAGIPVCPRANPIPGEYQKKKTGMQGEKRSISLLYALAGLPGETIYQVADSAMSIIITNAEEIKGGKQLLTGYIPLPAPLDRANVYEAEAKKGETVVDLSKNKKMFWEKKTVRVPWTQSDVTLQNPVTLEKRDTVGKGRLKEEGKKCLKSPLFGDIKVMEILAPGCNIWANNYEIDYELQPTAIPLTKFLGVPTGVGFNFGTDDVKIKMDVIQGRDWTGFRFSGKVPSISLGPSDLKWINTTVYENPSFNFEIHTNGYFKFGLVSGSGCKVEIMEGVELENPEINFLRDCSRLTSLYVAGTFIPSLADGSKIFSVKGSFYMDSVGMYAQEGGGIEVSVFKQKIAEGDCAYSSGDNTFTYSGDIEIFGIHLFDNVLKIYLDKDSDDWVQGSASQTITVNIRYWWGHWRTKTITATIGVKYHFNRDGKFGIGLGHYDFHVPDGGNVHYSGPFECDGITYEGNLDVDNETNTITAKGKTNPLSAKTNDDTVSTTLSLDGQTDGGSGYYGTITAENMNLLLHPTVQPGQTVAVNLTGQNPQLTKNPDTGTWNLEPYNVEVKYTYKDSNGNDVNFDQECQIRMSLNSTSLTVELDLPSDQGGTYSQVFTLPSK